MNEFLCVIWPYLAGGLVGWLLCGLFARRLKHTEPPIQKIVEVEKPVEVERIVEVEKPVDNPAHMEKIKRLKAEIEELREALQGGEDPS